MNDRETTINEGELISELKDIENIKMDVVPARVLYGNILKTIGLGFLYTIVLCLFPFGFYFLADKEMPLIGAIIMSILFGIPGASIFYIIPAIAVFNLSYKCFLFKEGMAPHLKCGKYLCQKIKNLIKKTMIVHFVVSAIIAFLFSFSREHLFTAFYITITIVSILTVIVAETIFKMELIRLGAPNLLEMIKDIVKPGSKVNG